jgi:acetyl esterase/lipase
VDLNGGPGWVVREGARRGDYEVVQQPPGGAPSLIVHGDADMVVPIVEGETMHAALTKAGVRASFIRIEGAGHGFGGAGLERANAAMVRWFERYLGKAAQ